MKIIKPLIIYLAVFSLVFANEVFLASREGDLDKKITWTYNPTTNEIEFSTGHRISKEKLYEQEKITELHTDQVPETVRSAVEIGEGKVAYWQNAVNSSYGFGVYVRNHYLVTSTENSGKFIVHSLLIPKSEYDALPPGDHFSQSESISPDQISVTLPYQLQKFSSEHEYNAFVKDQIGKLEKKIFEVQTKYQDTNSELSEILKTQASAFENLFSNHPNLEKNSSDFLTSKHDLNYQKLERLSLEITRAQKEIENTQEYKNEKEILLDFAKGSLALSDLSYAGFDIEAGDGFYQKGLEFVDLIFDFTPGVSLIKDAISVSTGVNPVTGTIYDEFDKAIILGSIFMPNAASGMIKKVAPILKRINFLGSLKNKSGELVQGLNRISVDISDGVSRFLGVTSNKNLPEKIFEFAGKLGAAESKMIKNNAKTISKWSDSFKKIKIDSASAVNKELFEIGYIKPPYTEGKQVITLEIKSASTSEKLVRTHTQGNRVGKWLMKEEDIKGLTPAQIKEKFAMPEEPTHLSYINIPEGTKLRMGETAPNYGHRGGGVQLELIDKIPKESFGEDIPLNLWK